MVVVRLRGLFPVEVEPDEDMRTVSIAHGDQKRAGAHRLSGHRKQQQGRQGKEDGGQAPVMQPMPPAADAMAAEAPLFHRSAIRAKLRWARGGGGGWRTAMNDAVAPAGASGPCAWTRMTVPTSEGL